MTALKWIVTEAKKLKKQYPKRFATWREYVAQASAIYASKHKGKTPVGKKHKKSVGDYNINKAEFVETRLALTPRKKRLKKQKQFAVEREYDGTFKKIRKIGAVKKATPKSYHKDTKSHNVNIRVVSGVGEITNKALQKIKENNQSIQNLQNAILRNKETVKNKMAAKTPFWKTWYTKHNKSMSDYIKTLKKENVQLKKHIK